MFVLTVDQRKSRSREDLVQVAMDALNNDPGRPLLRGFERTAGDEMQAVVADAAVAGELALDWPPAPTGASASASAGSMNLCRNPRGQAPAKRSSAPGKQ